MRSCPRARVGAVTVCRDRVSVSQLIQNRQLTHRTVRTPDFPDFWVLGRLRAIRKICHGTNFQRNKLSTRLARRRLRESLMLLTMAVSQSPPSPFLCFRVFVVLSERCASSLPSAFQS